MPAARSTSSPLALEVTTAVSTPSSAQLLIQRRSRGRPRRRRGERLLHERLLAVADLATGPRERDAAGAQEVAHAVEAGLAVDVREVVALEVDR